MSKFKIHYNKNKNIELFRYFSDVSENKIKNMQNYIPIYSKFFSLNSKNYNDINLNQKYSIEKVKKVSGSNLFTLVVRNEKDKLKKESFFKFSPLIDTSKFMVGKYKDISENVLQNLPKITDEKETVLKKMICNDNAAYTDSFFSYLTSKILHEHKFVHGIDFYGSFLGIKDKLKVDITDDLEYLYDYDFFHENNNILFDTDKINEALMDDDTRKNRNTIKIGDDEKLDVKELDNSIFEGLFQELTKENLKKFNKNIKMGDIDINNSILDYEKQNMDKVSENSKTNTECSSRVSDTSSENDNVSESSIDGLKNSDSEEFSEEDSNDDSEYEEDSDEFTDSSSEESEENTVYANIYDFPCQIICLEKLENTLDVCMEEEDYEMSQKKWIACLFQVIMSLVTFQKLFNFTHNDLHTNNIMFTETDKTYLNYKYNGKHYRVPTYGRIYKIIDFGRAIYNFDGKQMISDSFYLKGDAAGQYNFSCCKNINKKEILPNMGFDLCRLGCALYDYFITDVNQKLETPLEKLINEWVTDDSGKNILYKTNGDERYPDFKLYKMISRKCTNHIPEKQLEKDIFKTFLSSKKKIGKKAKIMDIDSFPVYI